MLQGDVTAKGSAGILAPYANAIKRLRCLTVEEVVTIVGYNDKNPIVTHACVDLGEGKTTFPGI